MKIENFSGSGISDSIIFQFLKSPLFQDIITWVVIAAILVGMVYSIAEEDLRQQGVIK